MQLRYIKTTFDIFWSKNYTCIEKVHDIYFIK